MKDDTTNNGQLKTAGLAVAILFAVGTPTVIIARWSATLETRFAMEQERAELQTRASNDLAHQVSQSIAAIDKRATELGELSAAMNDAKIASQGTREQVMQQDRLI